LKDLKIARSAARGRRKKIKTGPRLPPILAPAMNNSSKNNGGGMRFGIVARLSAAFGLLVFSTALLVYAGSELRMSRLYRSQRLSRVAFLAKSMSFGIENLLVSSGSREQITQVADDVLRRIIAGDTSITGCEIRDRNGAVVYSFFNAGTSKNSGISSFTTDVKSEKIKIGSITLFFDIPSVLENEQMRRVVMLGNTVAAMVRHYLVSYDYFQVKFLSRRIIESDPDVIYASVTGPDGRLIYDYRTRDFGKYITPMVNRRAMRVSPVQPILVQELGSSRRYGRMVDVSMLIEDNDLRVGVVRIGYSTASIVRSLARERLVLSLLIVGFTLLAFGIALLLAGNITRPLAELTRLARGMELHPDDGRKRTADIAESELKNFRDAFDRIGARLTARGDEVADLATAFRAMIDSLENRIRELKDFYQQISIADRFHAMGQLTAGIAHEINNPLTIISTNAQVILRRPGLDPEMRGEVQTILEEIDRIAEKVKDLLSFAQESKFEFAVSDIHVLVRKSLELTRRQFEKNGIQVVEMFDEEDPLMIPIDSQKLRQALLNLILNAVHAMDDCEKKELRVGTRVLSESNRVEIFFSDTGCGVAEENLGRIFDPFFTTKKAGVGTGLGLAICYNIAAAHQGELLLESRPGEGATFRIILPRSR
jgi:signal transduction histidine kinase